MPEYPNDDYVKDICKIGQGAACCRYLALSGGVWSCEKSVPQQKMYLDQRVADGSINARGDNCPGLDSR